jgi:predicted DNA-binding WGR domain protein
MQKPIIIQLKYDSPFISRRRSGDGGRHCVEGSCRRHGVASRSCPTVQCESGDDFEACAMNAVHLRCIDPPRNMHRFYRLDVEPLFGGVLLMKEWGCIGAHGRMMAERYDTEALAAAALQRQAERKRRRGYTSASSDV